MTQGDTDSPIIFNLIVDEVLRKWKKMILELKLKVKLSESHFYVDDGKIENTDLVALQKHLNMLINLFNEFGLEANEDKTKVMILRGAAATKALSAKFYDRIKTRSGLKHSEWRK